MIAIVATATTAVLRVRGSAAFGVAALIIAGAIVVAILELLSAARLMTAPAILGAEVVLTATAAVVWTKAGRPLPPRFVRPGRGVWAARSHPVVATLCVFAAVALAFQLFMAVAVAPNEYDSLLYHLPRAAYWLQHHSALQLPPNQPADPRVANPPNAELLVAWTMALGRTDRVAQLVQWSALVGLAATIFAGARMLGFRSPAALFAAGLFVTMPAAIVQASTSQNDLLVAFFVAGTALFGVRWVRDRSPRDLAVAAIALGMAVGTKGTALIAGPSLLVIFAAAAWRYRPPRRLVLVAGGVAVAAVGALGAFNYVQNLARTGSITGGISGSLARSLATDYPSPGFPTTLGRVSWTFVDAPGAPVPTWLTRLLDHPLRALFAHVPGGPPDAVKTDVSDDESSFGPTGLLLLLPLLLITAARPRAPPAQRVLAFAALAYLVVFAAEIGYSPESGRLLMPFAAFGAPLLATLAARAWLRWIALALALAGLLPALVLNQDKPLLLSGERSILRRDRLDQQLIEQEQFVPALRRLGAYVPARAPFGFVVQRDNDLLTLDYLLFGERRQRRVIPLQPHSIAPALRRGRVAAVVIWRADDPASCRGAHCAVPPEGVPTRTLHGRTLLLLSQAWLHREARDDPRRG